MSTGRRRGADGDDEEEDDDDDEEEDADYEGEEMEAAVEEGGRRRLRGGPRFPYGRSLRGPAAPACYGPLPGVMRAEEGAAPRAWGRRLAPPQRGYPWRGDGDEGRGRWGLPPAPPAPPAGPRPGYGRPSARDMLAATMEELEMGSAAMRYHAPGHPPPSHPPHPLPTRGCVSV
jgi:hypothetical protein